MTSRHGVFSPPAGEGVFSASLVESRWTKDENEDDQGLTRAGIIVIR